MDPLERLLALREIDDLIGRYCMLFDDQKWDAFAELWTDDAAFVVDGVAFKGRDVMLEFLRTCLPEGYQSKHMISPPIVELPHDGMQATAKTDVVWIAQNFENAIVARYDDDLVRGPDGWRIRRRSETALRHQPGPPPMSDARCASAARRCGARTLTKRPDDHETTGASMSVVRPDIPEFEDLISPDAELTQIGTGYVFSEGPVWSVAEQALYFSDIPGDKRFKWTASAGMELVMFPTFKANGMAFDVEGRLIVCEHVSSSISRFHADGFRETVCFHHGGVYLNSPNDLVASSRDGSIYFTDPDYGRWNDWIGSERVPLLGFKGVFRVAHEGGEAQLVVERDEFEQPNGLCFSPDESLMYVNDSPRAEIKVFDVADDGSLVNGRAADRHRWWHDRGGLGRRDGV